MTTPDDATTPRVAFWPVGCGDSTTVFVTDDIVMQIDLRHMVSSADDDTPTVPVIDRLEELLPKGSDGRAYLAVAAFTHLDKDHCCGAADLLKRVTVGELWFTPRSFVEAEADDEMCEDGEALHTEALRRLEQVCAHGAETPSGDRMRIIGYDDVLDDLGFDDYPESLRSLPGDTVTELDGVDCSADVEIFLHSPFRDDCGGDERNASSLGMRVKLTGADTDLRLLLLGDLDHTVLERLLDISNDEDLEWDVFLAPHHCSKSAVIDDDGNEVTAVTDRLADTKQPGARVIASSPPFPDADVKGANPPHRAAREIYERIVGADNFVCTGENGDPDAPDPVTLVPTADGVSTRSAGGLLAVAGLAAAAVAVGAAVGKVIRPGNPTVPKGDRKFA